MSERTFSKLRRATNLALACGLTAGVATMTGGVVASAAPSTIVIGQLQSLLGADASFWPRDGRRLSTGQCASSTQNGVCSAITSSCV